MRRSTPLLITSRRSGLPVGTPWLTPRPLALLGPWGASLASTSSERHGIRKWIRWATSSHRHGTSPGSAKNHCALSSIRPLQHLSCSRQSRQLQQVVISETLSHYCLTSRSLGYAIGAG